LEETMAALDLIVRQGKALYVGISSYNAEETKVASKILKELGTPCLIHQPKYSMLDRWIEDGLLDVLEEEGIGCITFSTLAQGLLSNKYLNGVPSDSRAASGRGNGALEAGNISQEQLSIIKNLNELAAQRGQTLAQMALSWALRDARITSTILGVSKPEQLLDSIKCLENRHFEKEELERIDQILRG
jgi:L-glyceraldehyde 3-phosphate reductase